MQSALTAREAHPRRTASRLQPAPIARAIKNPCIVAGLPLLVCRLRVAAEDEYVSGMVFGQCDRAVS
jgi:hypothetical protein